MLKLTGVRTITTMSTITKQRLPTFVRIFSRRTVMSFRDVSQQFIYYSQFGRQQPISKQTLETYISCIRRLSESWGDFDIERISQGEITDLRKSLLDRNCSLGYVHKILSIVRALFRYAREELSLDVLDHTKIKLPVKRRTDVEYLNVGEVDQFLKAIDVSLLTGIRFYALVVTLLVSGMRISECLSLNRSQVEGENPRVYITGKGNKKRLVRLNDWALHWINQYLSMRTDTDQSLFTIHAANKISDRWTPGHVRKEFQKIVKLTGLTQATPHAMRRTGATLMRRNGANLKAIQSFLGHSSLRYTEIYVGEDEDWVTSEHSRYMQYGIEQKPEVKLRTGWARQYNECIECKATDKRHASKGLCINCNERRKYRVNTSK